MSRQPLDGGDVGAGVQQFGNERPPQVVRRARQNSRLPAANLQAVHQCLGGHRPVLHGPALVDGCQQRAIVAAALFQPGGQGGGSAAGRVHDPQKLRATLAAVRAGRYTRRRIQRKMKPRYRNLLLSALVLLAAPLAHAQDTPDWKFREGVHYDRLVPAQGTSSPKDKIEVAEFFTYGCTFCYQMDAYVEEWRKKQPGEVNFMHIPGVWDAPVMEAHARLFLAMQATGVLQDAHRDAFRAIHTENRPLIGSGESRRAREEMCWAILTA